ncbi:MAG: S-formylglutathione hydrolase [Bdellovibrionota bacterium]
MKKLKEHFCFGGVTEFWEHDSQITKTSMKFSTHRPQNTKDIKGGLIWLSGLTCNEENFITKAGAQRVLSKEGLVIICPDTSPRGLDLPDEHKDYDFGSGAGFYVDATVEPFNKNYQMYSYINDEVYALFNSHFNLKGNVGIFGHSMGGHGALVLGLRNPERYKSISAFSPIVNPTQAPWGQKAFTGYLGRDQKAWSEYDACELIKSGAKHPSPILIDQGLADNFYPEQLLTNNFKEICAQKEQACTINLREHYDHSYYFISTFIEEHLLHHKKRLLTQD